VMGDARDAVLQTGQRNADERRLVLVQAVFDRM